MRSITLSFLAIFLVASFITGCTLCSRKTVNCPAFADNAFAKWFPYNSGQTLVFADQAGHYDTIAIGEVQYTEAYQNSGVDASAKDCTATGGFNNNPNNDTSMTRMFVWEDVSYASNQLRFGLGDFYQDYLSLSDSGISTADTRMNITYLYNYSIGGRQYPLVQELARNDTAAYTTNIAYRFLLAPGHGFVAYETYPAHTTWLLQ